jgi:hypothetical protein
MMKKRLAALALSIVLAVGLMPALAFAAQNGDLAVGSVLTTQASTGIEIVNGPNFYGAQTVTFKGRSSYCRTSGADNNAVRFVLYKDGERIANQDLTFTRADWNAGKQVTWQRYCDLGSYKVEFFHIGYDQWSGGYVMDDDLYEEEFTVKAQRKANTMTVKAKSITFSAKTLKKKMLWKKAFAVKNAKGEVTYKTTKWVNASAKKAKEKLYVSDDGYINAKRGVKAGTYKYKVKVTAAGNDNYKPKSKTVTLTVEVK